MMMTVLAPRRALRAGLIAAAFASAFTAPVLAQAPAPAAPATQPVLAPLPTAAHLQAARDVIIVSGLSSTFTNIYNDFIVNTRQNLLTRPDLSKDLEAVFATLKSEADKRVEDMTAQASLVFARAMSEQDLKEVSAFFNSPVGRKYNQARPQMINDVYAILQPWAFRTTDFMFQYTRAEMKKRGHDIGG